MKSPAGGEEYRAVIVHQMGKVGSSSVYDSLKHAPLKVPVYHTHLLNRQRLDRQLRSLTGNRAGASHLRTSQRLLEDGFDGSRWKIISLTRDPISRNISAFFQNVENFAPGFSGSASPMGKLMDGFLAQHPGHVPLHEKIAAFVRSVKRLARSSSRRAYPIDELIDLFLAKYPHDLSLQWFDMEIKRCSASTFFRRTSPASRDMMCSATTTSSCWL